MEASGIRCLVGVDLEVSLWKEGRDSLLSPLEWQAGVFWVPPSTSGSMQLNVGHLVQLHGTGSGP